MLAAKSWLEVEVDEMSKSGTYGDDITLMAAEAWFLRPLWVVGPDSESHEASHRLLGFDQSNHVSFGKPAASRSRGASQSRATLSKDTKET